MDVKVAWKHLSACSWDMCVMAFNNTTNKRLLSVFNGRQIHI